MERKFVPVEQRGSGHAGNDNDVPNHLRNDNRHSNHADGKTGNDGMPLSAASSSMCMYILGNVCRMHAAFYSVMLTQYVPI